MKMSILPNCKIFHVGDIITFKLEDINSNNGTPILRSTIGLVNNKYNEIIELTEKNTPLAGTNWHDLEMINCGTYAQISLPLTQVGIFEAKCCMIDNKNKKISWSIGDNFIFKVESADNVCGNSIYCAFVRQFSSWRFLQNSPAPSGMEKELTSLGFSVLPPSGTFRDLKGELEHIFDTLNCKILQLLPIHPAPTVYGRMGRYGSPFASLDYFNVDSALANFDVKATPLEQFIELIDAVHSKDGRIFMDIPVNHTGWASQVQNHNPEYFVRHDDKTFESPGAWGTVWEDLCKLNYKLPEVHRLMADVFLYWCKLGIDGFRCDAGYMLPKEAWDYIVSLVRKEYPNTVFLLEGLGGKLSVQEQLLGVSDLDWGYSELFQNYDRNEISNYFKYAKYCSENFGTLINFAETHDNSRLAAKSQEYSKMRFAVSAFLSTNGAIGFANGAEFFATEKIDVHGSSGLNWDSEPNLNSYIGNLNKIMSTHSAFFPNASVNLVQVDGGNVLAIERISSSNEKLLGVINLDCDNSNTVKYSSKFFNGKIYNILNNKEYIIENSQINLGPAEALLLSDKLYNYSNNAISFRKEKQQANAMALTAATFYNKLDKNIINLIPNAGERLCENPLKYLQEISQKKIAPVTIYDEEYDENRVIPLPPNDILLVKSKYKFHVRLCNKNSNIYSTKSLLQSDGKSYFAIVIPPSNINEECELDIYLKIFKNREIIKKKSTILLLQDPLSRKIKRVTNAKETVDKKRYVFSVNEKSGYSMFPAQWGKIYSKYDAIIAANTENEFPIDRRIMFSRLRGWINYKGYSQEIACEFLEEFSSSVENKSSWLFNIPVGNGAKIKLLVEFEGSKTDDAIHFKFSRIFDNNDNSLLDSGEKIKLILRPDIDDRINHQLSKAYTGLNQKFSQSINNNNKGFSFSPNNHTLNINSDIGKFIREDEWYYMLYLADENLYGLEDKTDLYSPGYFEILLDNNENASLFANVGDNNKNFVMSDNIDNEDYNISDILKSSINQFIVKRNNFRTVIAGYPWFLDWGRDTLIAVRGMIACDFKDESKMVLQQFAMFEESGTIPNMIRGNDNSNRDTSDAALYLIVATSDYDKKYPQEKILETTCGKRKMKDVLLSIVKHYRFGTPNGIKMDESSALIFSPSHFTWMDTNFPAATPRQGYPIEIQALWIASLNYLSSIDNTLLPLANLATESLEKYFFSHLSGRVSDCLHCNDSSIPASKATPDDHTRSNMLTAITLNALKSQEKKLLILQQSEKLLVPGGIRSLADMPVDFPLYVYRDGQLLNDPHRPYWGRYSGPEDTERKVAYHNGTVWCWPFPNYCEALYMLGGKESANRALAILFSASRYLESGVIAQLPEVAYGNAPHKFGGCPAQAWSITELARVYNLIQNSF